MNNILKSLCVSILVLTLASCGAGSSSDPAPPSIQTTSLSYDKQATFYVGVSSLNPGVTFSASNCSPLQSIPSNVANFLAYTCKVTSSGPLVFTGTDAKGKVIATQSFTVPNPQVLIDTNQGSFVVELNLNKAPISTINFLRYVDDGFYKDTLFHRVISNFVVQAGGFTAGPVAKPPTYDAITLESQNGLSNIRGSLAMARTTDFNSATSQFYINLKDNTNLDYVDENNPGYAVFGSVIGGLSVIDKIAAVPTDPLTERPKTDVVITRALRVQ
jgi:cyclophilin family peptidyl-prolyl cis-trans isomerase